MSKIPDLPGKPVQRGSEQESWLRGFVGRLCGLSHDRFPGSQPVSFGKKDIDRLEQNDYWVCEKSDGVRVLLTILTNDQTNEQLVHIVDRHNSYRSIDGIFFPHYENPERPLRNTIIDAELVIDTDPTTGKETLRMLCFDCLVADGVNVMSKTLESRYGRLKGHFHEPYARMKRDFPEMAAHHPFDIKVKEVNLSYHLEKVFNVDIPKLQHGNDGLIYTPVATPYVTGTDKNILKWKPPSENSIDFKLVLRFPPLKGQHNTPDLHAKPIFALHVWCGGEASRAVYEPYDVMQVEDSEWEDMKASGEQVDDRVVEVHWDPVSESWRMMRFRDDKPHGNHRNTVESIIQSIADGVERDILLARSNAIKNAWKQRQNERPAKAAAAAAQPQAPPAHQPGVQSHHPSSVPVSAVLRYGPLAPSPHSKVGGPPVIGAVHR